MSIVPANRGTCRARSAAGCGRWALAKERIGNDGELLDVNKSVPCAVGTSIGLVAQYLGTGAGWRVSFTHTQQNVTQIGPVLPTLPTSGRWARRRNGHVWCSLCEPKLLSVLLCAVLRARTAHSLVRRVHRFVSCVIMLRQAGAD